MVPAGAKRPKPLNASIPPGFAYFHVSWHDGGYVHLIDNEETFPKSFGEQSGLVSRARVCESCLP